MNILDILAKKFDEEMKMTPEEEFRFLNDPEYKAEKIYNVYARKFIDPEGRVPRYSTVRATEHPFLSGFYKTYYYKPRTKNPFENRSAAFVHPLEKGAETMFINLGEDSMDPELRNLHEADHLWTVRGQRAGVQRDREFAQRAGIPTGEFVARYLKVLPYLRQKYPELNTIGYGHESTIKSQELENDPYTQFNEIMATLVALEMKNRVDLTKDPVLQKTLFDPRTAEAYKSLTGWRATRWDPKDPEPMQWRPELVSDIYKSLVK
jgi:hypothetical protein